MHTCLIIFPVHTGLITQTQSSDWNFAGFSFIVEPENHVVATGTESITLKCRGNFKCFIYAK